MILSLSLLTTLVLLATSPSAAAVSVNTRGMTSSARAALEAAAAAERVACANGQRLSASQWNDGYCDCRDGSDEPGTAACAGVGQANALFFCLNAGYVPRHLSSLFVDDGICDCCDGSDEPRGRCEDSCELVGRAWRADLEAKIAQVRAGALIRASYVAEAKMALAVARSDRAQAAAALAEAEAALTAASALKATWEVREKLARRVLDARGAAAAPAPPAADDDLVIDDGAVEVEAEHAGDELTGDEADEDEDVLDDVVEAPPVPAAPADAAAAEEELHDAVFEQGPQDDATLNGYITRATEVRKSWQDAEDERSKHETRLRELDELLKEDFGPDSAFYALKGKCYSFDTPEYKYELCPFASVTQKQLTGHGGTSMGRWDGPSAGWVADSQHSQLDFKGGQGCWQGPERSCRVFVSCGADNVLSDTQEPNKCEYTMKFLTPAACTPATLAALEAQLNGSEQQKPQHLHSEL